MSDFDDFEDFEDDGFMDEDSFENAAMDGLDDLDDGSDQDSEPEEPGDDEFTGRHAFFVGSIVGNAYEEALDERRREKKLKRTKNDDLPM